MIDAILDPFAIDTSFKSSFPELDRVRMGLEMQFGIAYDFPYSGSSISLLQIRNGLCSTTTPISFDAMRGAAALGGMDIPSSGAVSFDDFRGQPASCDPG